MAIRRSSTSMSAISGTRSAGPSGGRRWKPCVASATGCDARPRMRLPLKVRMTLVFGVGMAVVLAGLGAFVYLRTGEDLLAAVDAGLRSRAQMLVNSADRADALAGALGEGKLADADEAFAQILDATGRIVATTSAVSNAPL